MTVSSFRLVSLTRIGLVVSAALLLGRAPQEPRTETAPVVESAPEADSEINAALELVFGELTTPGVVAGIARRGEPIRVGAYGVRCKGRDVPMETGDRVHIGSDTKAMTAALVARLVDRGRMSWDTTVAEALPELARKMHRDARGITVTQLLRHTAGLPANASNWWAHGKEELRERRRLLAVDALKRKPATVPGEAFEYSNLGVMIAGAMTEAIEDEGWEELMQLEVFGPLGITTAGFGPPSLDGSVEQPWGHSKDGTPVQRDNAPALGPAGTVHISVADWARFALEFTDGAAEESAFLEKSSRERLIEVGLESYAYGWRVVDRSWAGGTALAHSGSNTYWFATVWVAPGRDRAYLVAANAADPATKGAVDRMVGELLELDKDA